MSTQHGAKVSNVVHYAYRWHSRQQQKLVVNVSQPVEARKALQ